MSRINYHPRCSTDIERAATEDAGSTDEDEAANAAELYGLDGEAAATGESSPQSWTDDEFEKTTTMNWLTSGEEREGHGMQPITMPKARSCQQASEGEELHFQGRMADPWNRQEPAFTMRFCRVQMCHGQNAVIR